MTQSDKDFITRIQVSQLVTQDPYADDFYAQVYGAIQRSRMGIQSKDERVLKFTSGGGVGLGLAQKGGNRRPNTMLRMEQQVERIVSNARKREEEKGVHCELSRLVNNTGVPTATLFKPFTVFKARLGKPLVEVTRQPPGNFFKLMPPIIRQYL